MTEEPEFLTLDEILEVHDDQILHDGGDVGIRDRGLLESAIAMPRQSFGGQYLHKDIFEMATAYVFHVAESQVRSSMGTNVRALPPRTCSSV